MLNKTYDDRSRWSARSIKNATEGFLVAGIADGETLVRYWHPGTAFLQRKAARLHVSTTFPCIHRVQPVDPATHDKTGNPLWFVSLPKKDFARYAKDYAQDAATMKRYHIAGIGVVSDCNALLMRATEALPAEVGHRKEVKFGTDPTGVVVTRLTDGEEVGYAHINAEKDLPSAEPNYA